MQTTVHLWSWSIRGESIKQYSSNLFGDTTIRAGTRLVDKMMEEKKRSGGVSKRHNLQAVKLSQQTRAAVQIVSNPPAPSNGGPIYPFFWVCRPCGPAGWRVLLLTKAGDVETNPGPTILNKRVWICGICHKQIDVRKQISIRCNRIGHWVHLSCAGIRQAQYTDTGPAIYTENPDSHLTQTPPPPLPTLVQAPYPLPTYTTHTTATKTQTHVQHPPVPTGLVKPKPNSLIHSPPLHPTPP